MWYHKYRYASIRPSHYPDPFLAGKSFPILRFKIREDKVKDVELLMSANPRIVKWFHWDQVTLFEGASAWQTIDQKFSRGLLAKLFRRYNAS